MKYTAIILLFLAACSPQKRISRLCDKYPKLCNYDTTWTDTLISHRTLVDSSFTMNRIDTIVFERYGVKTQIYRHYDSFKVLQHQTDTHYVINTQKVITVKQQVPKWIWWVLGVIVLVALIRFLTVVLESRL